MLPLFEAKMLHLYDTRWATYERDGSTRYLTEDEKASHLHAIPRYWVAEADIEKKLGGSLADVSLTGWRRICRATDARTVITTRGPQTGYGDSWFLAVSTHRGPELQATWSSFALDFVARQKMGGTNMNFFTFMQLPMPRLDQFRGVDLQLDRPLSAWIGVRVDRLNGWISDPEERARVRAELDAAAFHLFGLTRDEASYVMETFPILKRKDEAAYGNFRTKELILDAYDAMSRLEVSQNTCRSPWTQEMPS